jgi:hypothetical protein
MKNKVVKILTKGLLLTFIRSSVLSIIALHIFYREEASGNEGGLIFILDLYAIVVALILTISSTFAYLNVKEKIRHNRLDSFLTFFAGPIFLLLVFLTSNTKDGILQAYIIFLVSFFLFHTIHYVRFTKLISSNVI